MTRAKRRKKHKQSILQKKDGRCYLCMMDGDSSIKPVLHKHHIFGGPRREASEAEGLYVYLCIDHHVTGTKAVHVNADASRRLKQIGQQEWEKTHTRGEWMKLMHKNYL